MKKKTDEGPQKKWCQELWNNITNLHMRLPGYESNRIYDHTIPEALSDNERVNPMGRGASGARTKRWS